MRACLGERRDILRTPPLKMVIFWSNREGGAQKSELWERNANGVRKISPRNGCKTRKMGYNFYCVVEIPPAVGVPLEGSESINARQGIKTNQRHRVGSTKSRTRSESINARQGIKTLSRSVAGHGQ